MPITLSVTVNSVKQARKILALLEGSAKFGFIIWTTREGTFVSDTITVRDNDAPVEARASFADVEGASVDVTATWAADDSNVAIITVDPDDDQHVTIEPGSPGATVVHCVGANEDGSTVELVGTFTVVPSDAVTGAIDFQPGSSPEVEPTT